jgi:hypothetical protein
VYIYKIFSEVTDMTDLLQQYLDRLCEEESIQEEQKPLQEIDPTILTISALSAAFSITNMAFRMYKDYFNKAARKCKNLPAREKGVCMVKAKLDAKNEQLSGIKRKSSDCSKTNKPTKCRGKLSEKIKKISEEVKFLVQRLQQLNQMEYK